MAESYRLLAYLPLVGGCERRCNRTMNEMMPLNPSNTALILIDMQRGFEDPFWGEPVDLPGCRAAVGTLLRDCERNGVPVVIVQHDSVHVDSPLHPANPGNRLFAEVAAVTPELMIRKHVNSAFLGEPDLAAWLRARGITTLIVAGIQTNMCVETTSRMGSNLGFQIVLPLDATTTFPVALPSDAEVHAILGGGAQVLSGEELMRATAANLSGGGFAEVTTVRSVSTRLSAH
ncbi:isochorismatase family protein [Glutamicibacter endophyticus]|uniref:isochorismatase family protein n=1 Tax=Glutamicibacter endophyticus TaxID=1522174 RepID=UPI003AF11350